MFSRWFLLVPAIFLLSPCFLHAQEEKKPFDPFKPNASNNRTMYEDIEIFRRILDRKMHDLYPQDEVNHPPDLSRLYPAQSNTHLWLPGENLPNNVIISQKNALDLGFPLSAPANNAFYLGFSSNWRPAPASYNLTFRSQEVRSTLEGVYLKGQGLVYTATLSSMQLPSKDAKAKTTKPVSEWESVRRQLRNEKEEPKKPEASKPPTLSDVLLKVLAENGHHFSRLGEKESLTIVLTVHEQGRSKAIRKPTEIPAKTSSPGPTGITPHSSKMRNLEMLGDLCMKQGRYNEAMDAFAKVLKLHRDSFTKAGLSSLDDAGRKREASVRLKLAQSLLLTGDDKQARTMLDQIITLLKNADDKKQTAPATKPAAAELPVKLIISAPKKLLDQVKEGKITFEEFRAKTHVETLRFDDHRSHK